MYNNNNINNYYLISKFDNKPNHFINKKNDIFKYYRNIYSKNNKLYNQFDLDKMNTKIPNYHFNLFDMNYRNNKNVNIYLNNCKKICKNTLNNCYNDCCDYNFFNFMNINKTNDKSINKMNSNNNIMYDNDMKQCIFKNKYQFDNVSSSSISNLNENTKKYINENDKKNKSEEILGHKNLYCTNCGKNNHLHKDCNVPITSYGIIAIKIDDLNNIKFLMIQRKYSLGFVEFIRGKYDINNVETITILIKQMVPSEIKNIKENTNNFEKLWKNLWGNSANKLIYTNEYKLSKEKFEKLCSDEKIYSQIINTELSYSELEWGFPKGRRKKYEKNIDCAIREFEEETNLTKNDYDIIYGSPYEEIFNGTNSVKYKHIYYLAILLTNNDFNDKNYNNFQLDEIANIGLFNYDETMNNVRSYHMERKKIIKDINNLITCF